MIDASGSQGRIVLGIIPLDIAVHLTRAVPVDAEPRHENLVKDLLSIIVGRHETSSLITVATAGSTVGFLSGVLRLDDRMAISEILD